MKVLYGHNPKTFIFHGKRYSSFSLNVRNVRISIDLITDERIDMTIIESEVDRDAEYFFESIKETDKKFNKIYELVNIYVNNGFGNYKRLSSIGDYIDTK